MCSFQKGRAHFFFAGFIETENYLYTKKNLFTMKKIFFFFSFLLLSNVVLADAWDNLTMEQAKAVVSELESNPYIFDYCDCCDRKGEYASQAYFLKVIHAEIVTCSWDKTFYSVQITADVIGKLKRTKTGLKLNKLYKASSAPSKVIYMNYTWAFNRSTKMASPFFNVVSYDVYGTENKPCSAAFSFPKPEVVSKVYKDEIYSFWYKNHLN